VSASSRITRGDPQFAALDGDPSQECLGIGQSGHGFDHDLDARRRVPRPGIPGTLVTGDRQDDLVLPGPGLPDATSHAVEQPYLSRVAYRARTREGPQLQVEPHDR
jgi:hypothetical protein